MQGTKKKELEVSDSELLHITAHWVIGGARRTESVVPRSQLQRGGASASTPATCLPSAFPAAGKDGDTSKSVFVQPLHKYPLSRLRLAEETALDWDSEMIIGGSVLLGLLF